MRNMFKGIATVAALTALMATSATAADKLVVKDASGTNPVFKVDDAGGIQVNDTTGTPQVVLTNTGRIGLGGNANPTVAIHAKGPDVYKTQAIMHMDSATPNANGGGGFIAYHNNNGQLPNSGDRLGYFLFGSINPSDGLARNGAGIAARAEGAWIPTSTPSYFTFETTPTGATGRTEKLRITSAGNIVAGNGGGAASGDLATSATNGFLYIPTVAGALTSCASVATYNGHVPVWFDTTNAKICTCQSGAMKCTPALN